MLSEHRIFQSLCSFVVVSCDPAVNIGIDVPARVLTKLGCF